MAKFMLLLHKGNFENVSPQEMQKMVEKYMAWGEKIRKSGNYLAGDELKGGGRLVSVKNQKIVDGPFTETKESVGGYYLIQAENLDEAVEVSKTCPHLDFQGEIEIREINPH